MKHRINIRGVIIPNDYKFYYNFFKMDSTCPADLKEILDAFKDGDEIEVFVNSPGGEIAAGSEIYTILKQYAQNTKIYITGEACSAASIVAMAAYCEMSPTALMMVHCVSSSARGNHAALEKTAGILRTADQALCTAYADKAGMSQEEALDMMEKETWLTAKQAVERGLVDKIMFEEEETSDRMVAGAFGLPSEEQMQQVREMMKRDNPSGDATDVLLLQAKLDFMRLEGEKRT